MSDQNFFQFFGGKKLLFTLTTIILIGIALFVFSLVSFIFEPFIVIFNTVIGPVILAFVLYYLLNPIVNLMERYRIKRLWGIIILIGLIITVFGLLITWLIPIIEFQITSLVQNAPGYLNHLLRDFNQISNDSKFAPYLQHVQEWVNTNLSDLPKKVGEYLGNFSTKLRSVVDTITSVAIVIMTFPFVLFFLLKDGKQFKDYVLKLTPPKFRHDLHEVLDKMNVQVGSYIQGQMIVAFCIGVLLFIGYNIIGLEYALILACIAAVTSVVPYLGPMIAISPAIILALVDSPVMLLKLAVVWMAVQFLEGHFISPNIMGKTMQIHPLTIIFVLLCAGNLLGLIGVILGIPLYAILKVLTQYLFNKFKQRYNLYIAKDGERY
ncbi:AI-2E family transporter [Macrococcus armenti]|uniref:AI-2E family transporter n=1 Tax=Macrococcus armenti TaxID=2875764 RepID=UPI001CCACC44|nr:AI-2E family transporter [Macrococcus armenti]UBH09655.1 AI-2E family transporter [Macrococcus armenti]UBH11929.1 AI-2E family transporter [Macrococcus armenti]UBH16460.1 AI-2E family transporter [Macrococcus armenti]UBH18816.1 AI-2E family transporter [Macrococcus armenti]UBH21088.1 AI-2E family transporter [Macrococcus armenti]